MTYLSSAIANMHKMGAHGLPKTSTNQPAIQKSFALLDGTAGIVEPLEDLIPFLERVRKTDCSKISRTSLNRILRGAWCDSKFDALAIRALKHANDHRRRSSDQAIIEGYLSWFPYDRNIIQQLSKAAHSAAMRHEWAWKKRSKSAWLFNPKKGPSKVANQLIDPTFEGANNLLTGLGLGNNLAASGFGQSIFSSACDLIADKKGQLAIDGQKMLLELFDKDQLAGNLSGLSRALLQPWITEKPSTAHRKAITNLLLDQIGDPRTRPVSWQSIITDISQQIGNTQATEVVQVLKRWLTDVAMREFFRAIMKTTDRKDQWRERQEFWLAYLEAGLILDAWPALGVRARHTIEQIMRQSGERSGYGIVESSPSGSSSLIMHIGNLRISEWSDNGSCRFWEDTDQDKPALYQLRYTARKLRTTVGSSKFEYLAHHANWQPRFANFIYNLTNIKHPTYGAGWSNNYY